MSARVRSFLGPALIFLLAMAATWAALSYRYAHAEDVPAVGPAGAVLFDAGVTPAVAPDPAPVAASTAPAPLPDPTTDPGGYARDVQGAFRGGAWFLLVVLGLFGVARTLLWVATRWSIGWLRRYTPVLVTASGLLAAVGASLGAGGSFDWQASLGALAGALALYLRVEPQPKQPAVEPTP